MYISTQFVGIFLLKQNMYLFLESKIWNTMYVLLFSPLCCVCTIISPLVITLKYMKATQKCQHDLVPFRFLPTAVSLTTTLPLMNMHHMHQIIISGLNSCSCSSGFSFYPPLTILPTKAKVIALKWPSSSHPSPQRPPIMRAYVFVIIFKTTNCRNREQISDC